MDKLPEVEFTLSTHTFKVNPNSRPLHLDPAGTYWYPIHAPGDFVEVKHNKRKEKYVGPAFIKWIEEHLGQKFYVLKIDKKDTHYSYMLAKAPCMISEHFLKVWETPEIIKGDIK